MYGRATKALGSTPAIAATGDPWWGAAHGHGGAAGVRGANSGIEHNQEQELEQKQNHAQKRKKQRRRGKENKQRLGQGGAAGSGGGSHASPSVVTAAAVVPSNVFRASVTVLDEPGAVADGSGGAARGRL